MFPRKFAAMLALLGLVMGCQGSPGASSLPEVTTGPEPTAIATNPPPLRHLTQAPAKTLDRPTMTSTFNPVSPMPTATPGSARRSAPRVPNEPVTPTSAPTPTPDPTPTTVVNTPTPPVSNAPTEVPTPTLTPTATPSPATPAPTIDPAQLVVRGKRLVERHNCLSCHNIDGRPGSAPTFLGLYGSERELTSGAMVTADADYLWESIKRPNEKIVLGFFEDAMSTVFFNDAEIDAMVEYIKSLE